MAAVAQALQLLSCWVAGRCWLGKLLAERAGVGKRGKESKGKERAESKGKAKADAKKGNKREPSELEKSLKGDKLCGNQISRRPAIDATLSL